MNIDVSKARATQLFTFIREFARLNSQPVESIDSYIKTFWLDQIPNEPECNFGNRTDSDGDHEEAVIESWLTVERPERPDPPAVSEELMPWVDERQWQNSAIDVPELHPKIINPKWKAENPDTEPQFLKLENHPHIKNTWDNYVEREWWPWAEVDNRKARVQSCYDELFAMHRTQAFVAEQYEFILAVGCLHWSSPSGARVKRHLLTLPVTIEFDSVNAIVSIRSAGNAPEAQLETDMLNHDRPTINIDEESEVRRRLLGDNLFHNDAKSLLKAYVQGLDSEGNFLDTFDRVTGTPPKKPVVVFAPALIIRRRTSRSLIVACTSIINQIKELEDTKIPACVRKLAGEIGVDKMEFGTEDSDDSSGNHEEEIYFPLPSNEEQRQILGRLKRQVGVLVQGPPGTGKSQTIVNLISHLLATGKRILVTSQKALALRVLKGKLPPEVADLCVMILGEGPDEQQELQRSVSEIANRYADWSSQRCERRIEELEENLKQAREAEAKGYERLCSIREKETFQHPLLFNKYEGTLGDIAKQIEQEEKSFCWFKDRLPVSIDLVGGTAPDCPINLEKAKLLLSLLRGINSDEEAHTHTTILPPNEIPSVDDFQKLVVYEQKCQANLEALSPFLEHPAHSSLANLSEKEFLEILDQINEFDGRLRTVKNTDSDWEWSSAEEVLRGNKATFEALSKASRELLLQMEVDAKEVGDMEVAGLGNRSFRVVLKDIEELKTHFEQGGKCGFWLFRPKAVKQGHYLIRDVKIDGRPCSTLELLNKLARWLRLNESTKKLSEQWAVLIKVKTDGFPLNQVIGKYREIQSRLDAIIDLGNLEEKLNERLDGCCRGIARHWYDQETIEKFQGLIEAFLAECKLKKVSQQLNDAEALANSFCIKSQDAPENHSIRDAIHGRLTDDYARGYEKLVNILECRSRCQERDQLLDELSTALPELARILRTSYEDQDWDHRLQVLENAWNWVCADAWLSQMADPQLENSLKHQVNKSKQEVSHTLSRLASEKAWKHCMETMTEASFQSLMAWRKAIDRLGKGTGKYAERNRHLAKERLEECRDAVPAWVMPVYKVLDTVTISPGVFDVVIIDEASQSGPEALFLAFLAKQVVVVGDDQQIRPENVGIDHNEVHQLQRRYLRDIPKWDIFGATESLFSIAEVRFGNPIRLREHFRCMPEIISFSNRLCYQDQPLIPLRQFGNNRLTPVLHPHYISGGYQEKRKINPKEAEAVVEAIEKCCEDPNYEGKTIGIISLLHSSDQDREIENRLIKRLDAEEIEQRNIVCGDAYDFQGDERDVIFLSMVSARSDQSRIGTLSDEKAKRRFNVAVSRARDQVFLFHSVQEAELGQNCLRRRLLTHMKQPAPDPTAQLPWTVEELRRLAKNSPRNKGSQPTPFDSWFESDVYLAIADQGYQAIPQYEVHGYRIDIVIVGGTRKIAVECDGDYWHGPQQHAEDLHRQSQLERCGWEFFRISGSCFYRDPAISLLPLWQMLEPEAKEEEERQVPEIGEVRDSKETTNYPIKGSESPENLEEEKVEKLDEEEIPSVDEKKKASAIQKAKGTKRKDSPKKELKRQVSTLEEVLSMPNRRLGGIIVEILEGCPNHSSKKEDLPKRVSGYFGFVTRGERRKQLEKKIGWAVTHLKKTGQLEEYKATNIRVRLRNPSKQKLLFNH